MSHFPHLDTSAARVFDALRGSYLHSVAVLDRRRSLLAEQISPATLHDGGEMDLDDDCIDGFVPAWRPEASHKD